MRWCPQIGAGTKKLSKSGQKLRWCPQIGAGAKKIGHTYLLLMAGCTAAFSFLITKRRQTNR
ncbi:MAG: hypothetical protein QM296_09440 [Bacillota bacterium]|nr:hypothetical protein [Bacillota bacterium]